MAKGLVHLLLFTLTSIVKRCVLVASIRQSEVINNMTNMVDEIRVALGEDLPLLVRDLSEGSDLHAAIVGGVEALKAGSLSWARLNQIMHKMLASRHE